MFTIIPCDNVQRSYLLWKTQHGRHRLSYLTCFNVLQSYYDDITIRDDLFETWLLIQIREYETGKPFSKEEHKMLIQHLTNHPYKFHFDKVEQTI
jgi:hypothetical protein